MRESETQLREIANTLSAYLQKDYPGRVSRGGDDTLREVIDKVNKLGERLAKEHSEQEALTRSYSSAKELYKGLFDNNALAVVIVRLSDRVVIDVNQACLRLLGAGSKEDFIGKTGEELGLMNQPLYREQAIAAVQSSKQSSSNEVQVRTRDGKTLWIAGSSNIVTVDGEACMLTLMMDTTEKKAAAEVIRKRTEDLEAKMKELEESEEKFQKAFHASSSGNTITRISDGRYVDVNDAFVKISGYTREELIGRNSADLGMVVSAPQRDAALTELQEHGRLQNQEISIRSKAGIQVDLFFSSETILVNGERFALNQIYDITERKETERQMKALNKELEAFSYSVSHDLRAPLRVLNGYTEMLHEDYGDVLDDGGRELIETIRRNTMRMNSLIDNLLEFSRMGRQELNKKEINMNEVMAEALIDSNQTPHRAKITIADMPEVRADRALLYQVVHNLMSNAIKYSSKKEQPQVDITSEDTGSEYVFRFKDNGTGFDQNYAHQLFGVFQRLHTQKDFPGIGVGLAIVQRIIFRHGGRVWAEGVSGEGANFYFSLPK